MSLALSVLCQRGTRTWHALLNKEFLRLLLQAAAAAEIYLETMETTEDECGSEDTVCVCVCEVCGRPAEVVCVCVCVCWMLVRNARAAAALGRSVGADKMGESRSAMKGM